VGILARGGQNDLEEKVAADHQRRQEAWEKEDVSWDMAGRKPAKKEERGVLAVYRE